MVLNFERIPIGAESMTVGGRVENWHERDDVRVVDRDELVGSFFFSQVLEFVHHDVHGTASRLFVHLFMESRR